MAEEYCQQHHLVLVRIFAVEARPGSTIVGRVGSIAKALTKVLVRPVLTRSSSRRYSYFRIRRHLPRSLVETLIRAEAMDGLGPARRELLWALGGLVYQEEGLVNLIVRPDVYERYRDALRNAPLLWVEGRLQQEGQALSVLVYRAGVVG